MIKFLLIAFFSLIAHADFHIRFESAEHTVVGDEIKLRLEGRLLSLPNGLRLSFGDIIAMGDFYGVVGAPMAQASSKNERKTRFIAAFNTLAKATDSLTETKAIVAAIHTQRKLIASELAKGRPLKEIYNQIGEEQNKKWNCLTGGACSGLFWWLTPGRYLQLAEQDFDHFGDNAIKAYATGHEVALEEAVKGNLELAYAMDAFANHFLTDRFSSGHMRLPRMELPQNVTPSVVGSLLAKYMHDEESEYGLHVHNSHGDQWIAYGDGHYFDSRNETNVAIMKKALQLSADEIHAAFLNKQMPAEYGLLNLIPIPNETAKAMKADIAPMFYWDAASKQLMRRLDLSNPKDADWTSDWFGWSTLAFLKGTEVGLLKAELGLD